VTVTVRFFASYAEKLGCSTLDLELPDGATVGDLMVSVLALNGATTLPPSPLVAVNYKYARADTVVFNGDEVAIIPPVAGG
jgi:molybdopterin converting factor subunit 1